MPETNSHEGISHPFGAKHGTAAKGKRDLADRMYPGFHDYLAVGDSAYASGLWESRFVKSVEAVKADLRELTLSHDEKYHAGWTPYVPEPEAPIPYCSVGARPLGLGVLTPPKVNALNIFHTEHQQIICSDGENFGLTNDTRNSDILIETNDKLHEYIVSPVKYRKGVINEARIAIDKEWLSKSSAKRYAYFSNNCQHYIQNILNMATTIARDSRIKLILD